MNMHLWRVAKSWSRWYEIYYKVCACKTVELGYICIREDGKYKYCHAVWNDPTIPIIPPVRFWGDSDRAYNRALKKQMSLMSQYAVNNNLGV